MQIEEYLTEIKIGNPNIFWSGVVVNTPTSVKLWIFFFLDKHYKQIVKKQMLVLCLKFKHLEELHTNFHFFQRQHSFCDRQAS